MPAIYIVNCHSYMNDATALTNFPVTSALSSCFHYTMKSFIRIFVILACAMTSSTLPAQWKVIAPNLVTPYAGLHLNPEHGAIHYKDGILWVGWTDMNGSALWFSADSGITWQKGNFRLNGDVITDINFYDRLNGVVSTLDQGVFLTRNGGVTWALILANPNGIFNVTFNGSPNIIHALVSSPVGLIATTTDGGTTWNSRSPGGNFATGFTIAKDGRLYVLNSNDPTSGLPGFVSYSTDLGNTWQYQNAEVDGDSYSICSDSCDPQKLYVANEDYTTTVNNISELYFSYNGGTSWTSSIGFRTPYFSGSMTSSSNAIYAASLDSGIFRSTDHGLTWQNMSNPTDTISSAFDTRNIACVNDNLVFLLDVFGSIWKTTNAGGDSLHIVQSINDLILSKNSLFSTDSLFVCDSSISRFLSFQLVGCNPPNITKIELNGADSASYSILPQVGDSLGVKFTPIFNSLNSSQVIITLSNGTQKIISLQGTGIPPIPLTLSTQNQTTDTLGGQVAIPISVNGLRNPEDITLVMHYDTVLKYLGSTPSFGSGSLDIPGEQWKDRSKLKIPNATSNGILGYANFSVFNDSMQTQQIAFDSLTVLSPIAPCEFLYYPTPEAVASIITPISGCGVLSISRFMHYGEIPQFAVVPNPTLGDASITSSLNLGDATVTIYDMLGAEHGRSNISLSKNTPAKISLPASNGVYVLRVKSSAGTYDLRVIVKR